VSSSAKPTTLSLFVRCWVLLALAGFLTCRGANATDAQTTPIHFGLAAAVITDNLDLYERWAAYLGRKVGRPIQFVQRRTYREALEMLETGEHDFAWLCSLPYAKFRNTHVFGVMAVPVFRDKPLYRSYIIVHKDRSFRSIAELEGRIFAYSEPDSNTGYLVPRQMLSDLGHDPDHFFRRTFFTYNHTDMIEAVGERLADGAAVASYVWEYLNQHQPEFVARTKVIQQSGTFGFPPLVYRVGVDAELRNRMTDALLTMDNDPEGRALLAELMLDRFITEPAGLYDSVHFNSDHR
jgi:phosphate/phosphite/phosphonate ABC transporter binding protein